MYRRRSTQGASFGSQQNFLVRTLNHNLRCPRRGIRNLLTLPTTIIPSSCPLSAYNVKQQDKPTLIMSKCFRTPQCGLFVNCRVIGPRISSGCRWNNEQAVKFGCVQKGKGPVRPSPTPHRNERSAKAFSKRNACGDVRAIRPGVRQPMVRL
jgi:hypothetical protein